MFQELAAQTGASVWAIASMLFFGAIWTGIAVWVFRASPEEFERRARLALEGEPGTGSDATNRETEA
jgi:hypothetical protein